MGMAYKKKLRHSKQWQALPSKEALHSHCPPTPGRTSFIEEEKRAKVVDRPTIRFVRVEDRIIKVAEGFFAQMTSEIRQAIGFTSGGGSTPERPIFLRGHSSDQFKQILSAYNAYPALDVHALTLDNVLTIGELSMRYEMRKLIEWFKPSLRALVLDHDTPLRTAGTGVYERMLRLAICLGPWLVYKSIIDKWVTRLHWGELSPIPALLFADAHGIAHLLSHACYVYLVHVNDFLVTGKGINETGALNQRQEVYIKSGYLSLRTTWSKLQRNSPEFGKDTGCVLHSQCLSVWKQRWNVFAHAPCLAPEVDVLNRLTFMESRLREDVILDRCMSTSCKALALGAIKRRRNQMARELHHHFDV